MICRYITGGLFIFFLLVLLYLLFHIWLEGKREQRMPHEIAGEELPKELQEILQQDVVVYIIVRFEMDGASFVMIDTGRRIALNGDRESKELVTENYELIKRLSKSVDYQYVLDMNYSVVTFSF